MGEGRQHRLEDDQRPRRDHRREACLSLAAQGPSGDRADGRFLRVAGRSRGRAAGEVGQAREDAEVHPPRRWHAARGSIHVVVLGQRLLGLPLTTMECYQASPPKKKAHMVFLGLH